MAKECTLSTVKLPIGGLPGNSVVRITDRIDPSSSVYSGRTASNQTNKEVNGVQRHELFMAGVTKGRHNTSHFWTVLSHCLRHVIRPSLDCKTVPLLPS